MMLLGGALLAASVFGGEKPERANAQNGGEFVSAESIPSAVDGVAIPPEVQSGDLKFDAEAEARKCESALAKKIKTLPLAKLVKDSRFIVDALALDAIRTAGATNLNALVRKHGRYGAFLKRFLADREFMTLYAGAGLVPTNTAEGVRVMADIWCRESRSEALDKSLAAGIAAAWGAGPLSATLRAGELLRRGDGGRCDPVWRYYFFLQSAREGVLHPNFGNLRPWELRFVVGNRWDDESLWWLQRRVNLPWDQYGWACWAAKYTGVSAFGATVQGALFTVHSPTGIGEGQRTILHGGVCGALSHVGCHAASAHGIPSYTVGQPGHCAYGFRLSRGKWEGGFGGPDGSPHNWIFPGGAPWMTQLMESAFKDDRHVDQCVVLLAFARAGVPGAWERLAKAWPQNFYVQQDYLAKLREEGDAKKLAAYAKTLTKPYAKNGFALVEVLRPFEREILAGLSPAEGVDWRISVNKAIANSPSSWMAKELGAIFDRQVAGLDAAAETRFVCATFSAFGAGENTEGLGALLDWAIGRYVGKANGEVFSKALATLGGLGGKVDAKLFAKAIVAAEAAGSVEAVDALTDLAEKSGVTAGSDSGRKLTLPEGERLVSDKGLLKISSTCGWDQPVAHRAVLRDAPGLFHTDKETGNWALVKLPEAVDVSTVMIVKNRGNESRSRHLKVSRSTDGATFFPLAESDNAPNEWTINAGGARTQWIKVERVSDEADFFHLRNILIFTKEAK